MKSGIKETSDLIIAINAISMHLIAQLKDGIQITDFIELYKLLFADDEFKAKIQEAYKGIQAVPSEVRDLDAQEIIALTSLQLSFLPDLIEAIKK